MSYYRLYSVISTVLIESRGLTTPECLNKVISGKKIGSDISSCFLRRLHKTADFGTSAVVGKAVIRQAFIRQRPASIWAHLATTPDSTSLESLAILANRALASENDVKYSSMGVTQIQLNDSERIIRIMEDISRRLKLQAHRENNSTTSRKLITEQTEQQVNKQSYQTQMQNLLFSALLKIIIMGRMFYLQANQSPVRLLCRRNHSKVILQSHWLRTMDRSAIIIKDSVIRRARAETTVHLL